MTAPCSTELLPINFGFVESIPPVTGSPTTVLDLNDGTWCLSGESAFPPPDIDRAEVKTLLTDGERYPASVYRNRVLELVLTVEAASTDDLATQLQLLFRQLDKPRNIILYQPKTSRAVYFRTFRTSASGVRFITRAQNSAILSVNVVAEPFAYGPKESLPEVTVTNDPAAVSNGMFFDVTNLKGDVETPPILLLPFTHPIGAGALSSVIAVRRRGTPANVPFLLQAESMTPTIADTTVQPNDPVMSGAGSNFVRTTFATTTNMTVRLEVALHPAVASIDARGTYRVFLRHRHSTVGDVIAARLRWGASDSVGTNYDGDTVTLPTNTNLRWTDLGLVSFPAGPDPIFDGYSGVQLPLRGMSFSLSAQRVSGSGTFDFDALVFVPADDRMTPVIWTGDPQPDYAAFDGVTDTIYMLEGTTEIRTPASLTIHTGGLPMLSPDATNRIYVLINAGPSNQPDDITDTVTILPSYWPRYLRVSPVTT